MEPVILRDLNEETVVLETTDKHEGHQTFTFVRMRQGNAVSFEDGDERKDLWFTHPNLYRREHKHLPTNPVELLERDYDIMLSGLNSYTTIHKNTYLDYEEYEKYMNDTSLTDEQKEELTRRFELHEEREIP